MKIRVYVYDIFPADQEINEDGQFVGGAQMTSHWINSEWMLWLFDLITAAKIFLYSFFYGMDPEDYMFYCRIAKKDLKIIRAKWPHLFKKV